jgi:uncharacterized protein
MITLRDEGVALIGNTYIVKDSEGFITYCPIKSLITRVDSDPSKSPETMRALKDAGFFDAVSEEINAPVAWRGFRNLTLLLTRRCNLRCLYCYASAGETGYSQESMRLGHALTATRYFVHQLPDDVSKVRITFHGGGEPTLEARTIRAVVAQAEKSRGDRKTKYLITTNGVVSPGFVDWMMDKEFAISLSADGPPKIQDRNRPLANGGPSSPIVQRTIERIVANDYPLTVRVTYSIEDDITEIVKFFGSLGVKQIHLEIIFPHGRQFDDVKSLLGDSQIRDSDDERYVQSFLSALDEAKRLGIRIHNAQYMGFIHGRRHFCGGSAGTAMMATHDGLISSCLEVVDSSDAEMPMFQLGEWNETSKQFVLDQSQLAKFSSRTVEKLIPCKDCYARYSCAGGCPAKAYRATGNLYSSEMAYCQFTRKLLPYLVKRIYKDSVLENGR